MKCKLLVNVCRCEVRLAGQPAKRGTVMYVGSYVLLFFIFIQSATSKLVVVLPGSLKILPRKMFLT